MTRAEAARHASLVRWGKENPLAARLAAIRERRKQGGGKGKGKAKGKAKQTPEQRQQERDAARAKEKADNREKVKQAMAGADTGLSPSGSDALTELTDGQQPNSTTGDGLVKMGLAEKGEDGQYHLTNAGRGAANAMDQGDYQRTVDAIASGEKQASATAEREQKRAEKEGKGGGGGGGGSKDKDKGKTDAEKDAEKEQAKAQKKAENRQKVGEQLAENDADLSARGLEALSSLTSGDEIDESLADGLVKMGLAEKSSDGTYRASSLGRQAARAAERGDYGATVDAVSRAKERKTKGNERDTAKQQRQKERRQREDERRAKEDERRKKEDGGSSEDDEDEQRKPTRQTATKGIDTMADYTPLLEDLTDLATELIDLAGEDAAAVKAGRRNNAGDQATIDRGYELSMELCDLFEALGADTGEEVENDTPDDETMEMAGKSVNYDASAQLVRDAWAQCSKPANGDTPYPWPQAVFDDGIIISQDGCLYFVPYERGADGVAFAERDRWKMARQTYITADGEVKAALEQAPGNRGIEVHQTETGEEIAILSGSGVKAIGNDDGWVGGYLVRFGGDGDLSEWRDVFDRDTDYGRAMKSDVYVHHRMLPGLGKRRLTNQAEIGLDDEGVFIKHLFNLRSSYERKLYGMVQAGKLGWSSGTAPHLVERKALGDGRHKIEQWPLGLDASYTPMPAGGLGVEARAISMKSLLADAGIDLLHAIYDNPEADDSDERERADVLKATADRTRRLRLQAQLLRLQE